MPVVKARAEGARSRREKNEYVPTLSYCFALIRPTEELALKYEAAMAQSGRKKGTLSDQDLLSEVLQWNHVELPHTCIMFPSWWNHADVAQIRVPEIMKALGVENIWQVTHELVG